MGIELIGQLKTMGYWTIFKCRVNILCARTYYPQGYIIPWDEKELGNADPDPTEGALTQGILSATDEKKKDWEWKSLFNVVDIHPMNIEEVEINASLL